MMKKKMKVPNYLSPPAGGCRSLKVRNRLDLWCGFTLIELVIALGGVGALAIGVTSFLFSLLSQKDQAVSESLVAEQVEGVGAMVGSAVRSARSIEVKDGGKILEIEGEEECVIFEWDEEEEVIKYGRETGEDCDSPDDANERITNQKSRVENLNFSLMSEDSSSRSVMMEITVGAYRPMWGNSRAFKQVFVNVVDEEGGDDD